MTESTAPQGSGVGDGGGATPGANTAVSQSHGGRLVAGLTRFGDDLVP